MSGYAMQKMLVTCVARKLENILYYLKEMLKHMPWSMAGNTVNIESLKHHLAH